MAANQPSWPREWLMTDERLGDRLWQAIDALPDGAGLVFRHYRTAPGMRHELARRVAEICRRRGLTMAIAANSELADELGARLLHNPVGDRGILPFSRSVHSVVEGQAADAAGAALIFVSPIHPTRSHPGERSLDAAIAAQIAGNFPGPAIALGGMNRTRFERLEGHGFYGWAGIDAWIRT